MSTTAAQREEVGITGLLESAAARKRIEPMLWPGTDYNRVIQEVYFAVKENPDLLECESQSLVRAVGRAVSWGLVIGETVHLVPFNVNVAKRGEPDRWEKRCKALMDYKGKIELIVRAGSARAIDAENVYELDDFVMELGSNPMLRHRPVFDPKKRGEFLGTYAVARLAHNLLKIIWVPAAEIEAIRANNSKQWKKGEIPPWYGPKTAVHRISKMLPKSERLAQVLGQFREEEEEEHGDMLSSGEPARVVLGGAPARDDVQRPVAGAGEDEPYSNTPRAITAGPARPVSVPPREAAPVETDEDIRRHDLKMMAREAPR